MGSPTRESGCFRSLVLVEAPVGEPEKLLCRGGLLGQVGGACAQRDALAQPLVEAVDEGTDAPPLRLDEDGAELVAAEAPDGVARPGRAQERGGEDAQEPVALGVPLRVVRLLEAVEVEEDEREPAPIAARPADLLRETGVEGAVVQEAGERIAPRTVGEVARDALDVLRDAAVQPLARSPLSMPVEDPPERRSSAATSEGAKPRPSRSRACARATLAGFTPVRRAPARAGSDPSCPRRPSRPSDGAPPEASVSSTHSTASSHAVVPGTPRRL